MAGSSGTSTGGSTAASGDRDHGSASNTCAGSADNTSIVVQVERSDGQNLSKPADVKINGPSYRADKTAASTDRVTFKPIYAGKYQVFVKPNGDEAAFNALPPHPQEVIVAQGEEKLATVKIAPPLLAHLHFTFTDPDDQDRNFPKNFQVVVVYNDGSEVRAHLDENGVAFWGTSATPGIPIDRSKTDFTLHFTSNKGSFVVCEKAGDTASVELGGASLLVDGKRGFVLPNRKWTLNNSDWTVTNASTYAEGKFTGLDDPNTEIGTEAAPVELKLTPHWQYHKFEFFDRKYGPTDHQARVSIPAVLLQGFRKAPTDAAPIPDTQSNWITGTDAKDMKQALPWILQKDDDGTTPLPKLNKDMEIRFQSDASSGNFIFSKSATERELKGMASNADEVQPGPTRLAYYDLPRLWRSRAYYTRKAGNQPGKFFYDLTEADIEAANTKTSPLIFCLDDIVLYGLDGSSLVPLEPLGENDKVVIFHHTFSDQGTDCSPQGVYKSLAAASAAGPAELPSSEVDITENYLIDYPDWTRLVIAQGNLFDVFDLRTPNGTEEKQAVGARAAVRWVDAMAPLSPVGIRMWDMTVEGQDENGQPIYRDAADPMGIPLPNRQLCTEGSFTERRPSPTPGTFFSMQHFWSQRIAERYNRPFNGSDEEHLGRCDIALLRCCGLEEDKEFAINLHYHKSSYAFDAAPSGSPQQYAHDASVNVANRWNGNDSYATGGRARLLPRKGGSAEDAGEPLIVEVFWFCQAVEESRAHVAVKVAEVERAWRSSRFGSGESGPAGHEPDAQEGFPNAFTTANVCGHLDGLPDEYSEQWESASYGQPGLLSNLPGDPFRLDAGALMNGSEAPRNRYYWPSAEWVRRRMREGLHFKVSLTDPGGTAYAEYYLPEHPETGRSYACWPLATDMRPAAPQPARPSNSKGGLRDVFLYALGNDHFSQFVLPGAGGEPFDGILLVVLKLAFIFPDEVTADERSDALAAVVDAASNLNKKWYATGSVTVPGSSPATDHAFSRCLIHFEPRVIVENFATEDIDEATGEALARDLIEKLKIHYRVKVYQSGTELDEDGDVTVSEPDESGAVTSGGVTADFSADVTSGDTPLTVQFTDGSSADGAVIVGWRWDFGDHRYSDEQNPSHTYTNAGKFTVSLTVTTLAEGSEAEGDLAELNHTTVTKEGHILASGTRWETSTGSADLERSAEFLGGIPADEQAKEDIQTLVTKLDEYHAIRRFHLTERIAKVGEIRLKAEGILEIAPEVTATWEEDSLVANSRSPLGKSAIDQAVMLYRSTGHTDFDGRLRRLATLERQLDNFVETADLLGGWSPPTKSKDIDIAIATYQNTPETDFEARLAALDSLQAACSDFIAITRSKSKLLNLVLYALIPLVEALESRVRAEKGDVAVMRGVANMKPKLQAKMNELQVLKSVHKLKAQARSLETDLKAQESSTTLLVEYADASQRTTMVSDAFDAYLLSMAGIYKLPDDITREDLIPLVSTVITKGADVQPLI